MSAAAARAGEAPKIVVLYHSGYGHTKRLADTVAAAAAATAVAIDPQGQITATEWDLLDDADMIVFGSPTYMGGPSWQFKRFADETSKRWMGQRWKDKLGAGFTNSASMNGDKFSTVQYFITLAMQHSMLWVGTGMLASNSKASTRDDLNYIAGYGGLLATTPSDASVEEMAAGDLETARQFGRRLATIVQSRPVRAAA